MGLAQLSALEGLIVFHHLHPCFRRQQSPWAPEHQVGLFRLGFWFLVEDSFIAFLIWELKALSTSVSCAKEEIMSSVRKLL